MNNPLLSFEALPHFDQIGPEHVAPAIEQLLAEANAALETVTAPDFVSSWSGIAVVLDVATERLSRAWGSVSHLNSVADTPELRAAYNVALPKVTEFYTRLGADERLYAKYRAINPDTLNSEQRQALKNALRNFVLGGADLKGADRERFATIAERQAYLSQKFSENALDATDAFAYFAEEDALDGLPEDVKQTARNAAQADGKEGFKLTLKMPCYLPVMQFADNRDLRAKMYRAYATRASEFGKPEWDNSKLMDEIVQLRGEEARLLGFANYGELSLAAKMAETPQQVVDFMRELAQRARPFAEKDLAELREFASARLGLNELHSWDVTYASEKLREQRYAFSEQEVKEYFPEDAVLKGLFSLVETLYDLHIVASTAPVWHESVHFFDIRDAQGQLIGQFYFDLYARNSKRGGAWMDDVITRRRLADGSIQTPVAYMNCNFSAPVGGKAALFTHDEVNTLFHEFGHGLHHLLTEVEELGVSGINGVEWDAVELPSQFMENFCWEWDVIKNMSAHVDTDMPLPRALFDKMLAAKNYQSGMQTLRQIEFSLFDMLLHTSHDPAHDIMPLLQQVRQEVAVLQPPSWARTAHTFSHIFAGGYAAGYYSYKWAEVLSSDAYAAFEETVGSDGLPNVQTGQKYRQAILEAGGSRPAIESFKAFRGREPTLDALLRHQGMGQTA